MAPWLHYRLKANMVTSPNGSDPPVVTIAWQFRGRLLAADSAASRSLIEAYRPVWTGIKSDIDSLIAESVDRQLGPAQVERLARLQKIERQIASEMTKFSAFAGGRITTAQSQSVALALQSVRRSVDAALPLGIDTRLLARAGIEWVNLPAEAFVQFVGFSQDGAPLSKLLDQIGPGVRQGVTESIGEGLARGLSPRDTAVLVRNRVGMGLTRALAISRTETLRSFREASRLQYAANGNIVKRYRRVSAKDSRVCMACMALDDKVYELDQPLDEHVNGRCAIIPETVTYRDLGIPVDQAPFNRETAEGWFAKQPESTQLQMMGPARFEAWRAGDFEWADMAKVESNPIWGDQAVTKPVSELI